MKTNKKWIVNLGKILISILLLYWVFTKIPFREVARLLKSVHFFYLFLGSIFFLLSQVLSAKRLLYFIHTHSFNLSFRNNLELYFLGMFYNFFIPGGIGGDAYKIYLLNKNYSWSIKKLTSALFNDRLSGLMAIILLIFFLLIGLIEYFTLILTLGIPIGIGAFYLFIKYFFRDYQQVFFKTLIFSFGVQTLQVISFVFLLKSIGVMANYEIYSLIFLASSILSLVSFAGIGVRELLFFQASQYLDFNASFSISASLLFTFITAFFSIFGLLFEIKKIKFEPN